MASARAPTSSVIADLLTAGERLGRLPNTFRKQHPTVAAAFREAKLRLDVAAPSSSTTLADGRIALFEIHEALVTKVLDDPVSSQACVTGLTDLEYLTQLDAQLSKPDCNVRFLIHEYRFTDFPTDHPQGLGINLLNYLDSVYGLHREAYCGHFNRYRSGRDLSELPPSQREVVTLAKHLTGGALGNITTDMCTLQLCTSARYPHSTLVVMLVRTWAYQLSPINILEPVQTDHYVPNSLPRPFDSLYQSYIDVVERPGLFDAAGIARTPLELVTPVINRHATSQLTTIRGIAFHLLRATESTAKNFEKNLIIGKEELDAQLLALQDTLETIKTVYGGPLGILPHPLIRDFEFVVREAERLVASARDRLSYNASMASLAEARSSIYQTQSVKRLTQLAFLFIPMSFVTSVFGMNVDVLDPGARWWTVIIGIVIVYAFLTIMLVGVNVQRYHDRVSPADLERPTDRVSRWEVLKDIMAHPLH